MSPAAVALSRRTMVAASLLLPSCRGHLGGTGGSAPPRSPVADAHIHLFNAADLPIAGFLKHVYIPGHVAGWPRWADALIDMFASFYKPLAISARAELSRLESRSVPTAPGPRDFSILAARFIEERADERSAATGQDIQGSYAALADEIRSESSFASRDARRRRDELRPALEDAAREARDGPPAGDAALAERRAGSSRLLKILGWGYLMTLPRGRHLRDYVSRFGSADATPRTLISLLVDYDLWLDDAPAAGSGHLDQVAVQHRLAQDEADLATVRLFAGYCPLKHAVELARGKDTHFARLAEAQRTGAVTGYKVYPPMGFRPWDNAALADAQFDPGPDGRKGALARWREAGTGPLGPALDGALARFYRHCADTGAPIVAHAGPGNEAGRGYGLRADPRLWEPVVRRFRVRLSLGHLVNEARPFIDAVRRGPPFPEDVWALHGSLRMLNRRPADAPDVYGDLAYMPELIGSEELAADFFRALRTAFGPGDPDLTRIMFGSDWVMTGIEPGDRGFLAAVEGGMRAAGYSATQRDNVLLRNAERFLGA